MTVTVTEVGRTNSTTASTTQNVSFTGTLAAGRTVVVFVDAPTGSTNTSVAVTDSKGNTYTTQEKVFNNSYAPAVATCTLGTGVTSSDTITVTLAVSSGAWVITVLDLGVIGTFDVSGNFANDGSTHASPTVSSSTAAGTSAQIVLAAFVNSNTTHTFTAGSGYTLTSGGVNQANTGTNARQLWVEYQEYTTGAGGVRTATGTYATAANYAAVLVAINVTGGGGGGGWAPVNAGQTIDTASATSKTITLTSAVPSGHKLVIVGAIPAATPVTTVAVTATGSTFTTRELTADNTYAPFIAEATVGTSMSIGAVITVTADHASTGWKLVALDLGPAGAFDVGALQATTSTASPSMTTAASAAAHQYAIAIFTNTNTTHAFTPGTGWTALPGGALVTGTGSTSNNLWVNYREYTSGGGTARVANGTFATAGNYAGAVVAITVDVSTSNTLYLLSGSWLPTLRLTRSGGSWV